MKRKTFFVVLSIILLCSAVTIGVPTGCCYYCPFCPPPSDTPIENPAPTPIPVRPTGGKYENPNLIAYIDDTISSSGEHNVVIVDVRSPEKYAAGHIPGAINLPWYSFRGENGVLIPLKQAAEKLGENGISRENRVIVYSDTCKPCGGLPASSYVAWMLEYLGQENVSVLDGGFDAWNTTYGCTKSVTRRPPTTYIPKTREDKFADTDWVQNNLNNTRVQIVDARTAAEYNAGHIDGAINIDYELLFREGFRMKSAYDLKYLFLGKGLDKSRDTVVYCRSGARSSFLYLALSLMGYKVRNYDGSWTIWSQTHPVPVITISNVSVNPSFVYSGTPVEIFAEVKIPSLKSGNGSVAAGTSGPLLFPGYRNAAYISNPFFSWDSNRSRSAHGASNSLVRAYIHKEGSLNGTVAMKDDDGDGRYTGKWQTFLVEDGTYYVDVEASDGQIKTEKKNAARIEVATDIDGPLISNVSVTPHLTHPGSEIIISANISDPSGILRVIAQIKHNNETVQNIYLSDPDRDGRYISEWKLSQFLENGTYYVSITATDRKFNKAGIEDVADFVIEGSF
ncbi:MAG: sulfurtransferase [Methanophagales archaeon]|nr:sulfurtransferase [Methanophagales archaeon]